MRASSLACAFAACVIVVASAGCTARASGSITGGLEQQLCVESELGGDYAEKTSGDLSLANLAALSDDSASMQKRLEADGLKGGLFTYWVHTVPKPPFEPPLEVVCQALEFDSEAGAQAFVAELKPTPDDLASSAMAWIAEGKRSVEELPLPATGDAAETLERARAFKLTASGNQVDFTIYAVVVDAGKYVRTVYIGRNGNPGDVQLADAVQIVAAVAGRVK